MTNLYSLLTGIFVGAMAQVLTFIQLQGQLKYDAMKNNYWLTVSMGIPISIMFMYSVRSLVTAFDGQLWPSRLIGFSIGTIVFSVLSSIMFNEPITTKTLVCLMLSLGILGIQLFWK
jgi:hypothetical protein